MLFQGLCFHFSPRVGERSHPRRHPRVAPPPLPACGGAKRNRPVDSGPGSNISGCIQIGVLELQDVDRCCLEGRARCLQCLDLR
ncbi:hypothetical protein DSECCO2_602410 [anaerobic digester metagenome]